MELPPEEVPYGREGSYRVAARDDPLAIEVLGGGAGGHLRHLDLADPGVAIGLGGYRVIASGRGHRPLHVRLARAQPDLADQHVLEDDAVRPRNRQGQGPTRGLRGEVHAPLAIGVRRRGGRLDALESDRDPLAGIGPAPHGQPHIALKYHVIPEDAGE